MRAEKMAAGSSIELSFVNSLFFRLLNRDRILRTLDRCILRQTIAIQLLELLPLDRHPAGL